MTEDAILNWSSASPSSILMDAAANAWHAGRALETYPIEQTGGAIVATDTGGVWVVDRAGAATPVSDNWDHPDINCLALDPLNVSHVYSGGTALYETDTSAGLPLLTWLAVPLPQQVGQVFRICISRAPHRIIIASDHGVWWSLIPAEPGARGKYAWRKAQGLQDGSYSGLCLGAKDSACAGAFGDGAKFFGLFHGDWVAPSGDLFFTQSTFPFQSTMHWISLASCDLNRSFVYAAVSDDKGRLLTVLSSVDGGISWSLCGVTAEGAPSWKTIQNSTLDESGGGWRKYITVDPLRSNRVAIGWGRGFVSSNEGHTWRPIGLTWDSSINDWSGTSGPQGWTLHGHEDVHSVIFGSGDHLYISGDGGVVTTPDFGQTFSSIFNRSLLNLQFLSQPAYSGSFYGTATAKAQFDVARGSISDVVVGGLQDNGNVFAIPGIAPWSSIESGDGGLDLFLHIGDFINLGRLIRTCNGCGSAAVRSATWNGTRFVDDQPPAIPIHNPGAPVDRNGLAAPLIVAEVIEFPGHRNSSGQRMYAVAAPAPDSRVFGLFANDLGTHMHWETLATIPIDPSKDQVWALASLRGSSVYIGTQLGRIFRFDVQTGAIVELFSNPSHQDGAVFRFLVVDDVSGPVLAIVNTPSNGYVLRLDGLSGWITLQGGLPDVESFHALAVDRTSNTIFSAVDGRSTGGPVYVSRDGGNSWSSASMGLPQRPHCADLRIVMRPNGGRFLYLSTYGRSLWSAQVHS